jgi:phosphate acyltransferase
MVLLRIGIDLMGSDTAPQILYEAVLQAAQQYKASISLVVIATHRIAEQLINTNQSVLSSPHTARIEFHLVEEFITMGDEPLAAIRHKKNSSLVVGVRLLKKHLIDALVSAGNTGALIASSTLSLPLLPGISRPALLALLPTQTGSVAVIDVGGNVSCKARHLVQFAHMGAAYQRCYQGIDCPKVGLLNIGVESKKGHSEVREAYQLLQEHCQESVAQGLTPRMHFVGNVEGRQVLQGRADVLVTDGFTGNVLLKTTEGAASFIFNYLQEELKSHTSDKLDQVLNDLQCYFNYAEYPGAIVCGVEGVVVKCHGNSSSKGMLNAIRGAINLVQKRLVHKIKEQLS